jgi:crotonobetainyl-CoA:carnitine CoA-transferase CaiB-like acyl-CoA transferase
MTGALPLEGIRVVEFVHMVMGPTCGLLLGDLGADVIKVEPVPDGDNTRRLTGSGAGYWPTYNRNKKVQSLADKSFALLRSDSRQPSLRLKRVGECERLHESGSSR